MTNRWAAVTGIILFSVVLWYDDHVAAMVNVCMMLLIGLYVNQKDAEK